MPIPTPIPMPVQDKPIFIPGVPNPNAKPIATLMDPTKTNFYGSTLLKSEEEITMMKSWIPTKW